MAVDLAEVDQLELEDKARVPWVDRLADNAWNGSRGEVGAPLDDYNHMV